jgi:hypothetical protein
MAIKAVFMQMGLIMGDFEEDMDGNFKITKPVLVITQRDNAALVPFLGMMEEQSVTVKSSDCLFGQAFTPIVELRNHYNRLFGTGIVEAQNNVIQLG